MWRLIGPALLFSGAAVGTSHLVQSTRAGAMYGLALVVVILAACLLKYPAFRFGVDYGHATRRSLVAGYRELGLWAPLLFAAVAILIVPVIYAALASATAGIAIAIFGLQVPVPWLALGFLVAAAAILLGGGYDWLDRVNRVLVAFLVVSTLVVTALVLPRVEWGTLGEFGWTVEPKAILFVIALAGFMPNPLDASVAMSMWMAEAEKREDSDAKSGLRKVRLIFFSGYAMTALLAVCFCIMGAGVMHVSSITPESSAPGFANQIISLYSETLGDGAAVFAAIAAFSVMLTTVLAALDVGGRHIASVWQHAIAGNKPESFGKIYRAAIPVLVALSATVLFLFTSSFTAMLDLATSAAFLGAPVVATLNHLVVTRCSMPDDARPSAGFRALNLLAIVVMASLAIAFFLL